MSTACIVAIPYRAPRARKWSWRGTYVRTDGAPIGVGAYVNMLLNVYGHAAITRLVDKHKGGFYTLQPHPRPGHGGFRGTCGLRWNDCAREHAAEWRSMCACETGQPMASGLYYGDIIAKRERGSDGTRAGFDGAEWLYIVTPDGLVTHHIKYRWWGPDRESYHLSDPIYDIREACRLYVETHFSEPGPALADIAAGILYGAEWRPPTCAPFWTDPDGE